MLHYGLLDLMNRSTCFGYYYAHHQELATILYLYSRELLMMGIVIIDKENVIRTKYTEDCVSEINTLILKLVTHFGKFVLRINVYCVILKQNLRRIKGY